MRRRVNLPLIGTLLLIFSSQVLAHNVESGGGSFGGLMHMFTGEHILMILLVGACVAGLSRLYRRFN